MPFIICFFKGLKLRLNSPNRYLYAFKMLTTLLCAVLIFIQKPGGAWAQNDTLKKAVVYKFELNDDIMPAAERLVSNALEEADSVGADIIFMKLNTYGGLLNVADSIRIKFLNAKPLLVTLIDKNAASAGALISIATDSIYMTKGANIGAATVVDQGGAQMPDKYQSYMRSIMRSTAEAQGRDPRIAEAMVDDRIAIPGIIDSGYTLTFTTSEAVKHGYAEGQAEDFEEVMKLMGVEDYQIYTYRPDWIERVIAILIHPVFSSILLLVIIGGIWFELQTPGVGFPILAAITAAILYFAPLYLEGLAENWEILLFILGIVLLALELFVIPGFGIAGIGGIILMVSGLSLALVRNVVFDFSFIDTGDLVLAFVRVTGTMALAVILLLLFGKNIFKTSLFQRLVLAETIAETSDGFSRSSEAMSGLIGQTGIAHTPLRPAGKIEIGDERYEATTEGEWISKGEKVKVTKSYRSYLVVAKV